MAKSYQKLDRACYASLVSALRILKPTQNTCEIVAKYVWNKVDSTASKLCWSAWLMLHRAGAESSLGSGYGPMQKSLTARLIAM